MSKVEFDKIDFRYHEPRDKYLKRVNRFYKYFAKYHDHSVEGMEHIPKEGPCLIAVNHSFATYDIGILQYKIYKELGVFPRGFADNAFFKVPAIGKVAAWSGAIPGEHHVGDYLLREKKAHILVAPGGMREALRPVEEKYKIKWERRKGFVKLAIKTNTPIILAACPAADDLYKVTANKLTKLVYSKFRLPLPIVRSYGKSPMPNKVKLVHYISTLQTPPAVDLNDEESLTREVDHWHTHLSAEMNRLMALHPVQNPGA
ncbi:MAG: acyltransferase family protein [Bacteroidetes bacterium]|nr:acyltransferase family protein [Bacteroidota bacterium]